MVKLVTVLRMEKSVQVMKRNDINIQDLARVEADQEEDPTAEVETNIHPVDLTEGDHVVTVEINITTAEEDPGLHIAETEIGTDIPEEITPGQDLDLEKGELEKRKKDMRG